MEISALVTEDLCPSERSTFSCPSKNGAGRGFQIYALGHVNLPRLNRTDSRIETIWEKILRLALRLQEEAIKMASIYGADAGQPMDTLIISESHLKELKSDDQRVRLFEPKSNPYKVWSVWVTRGSSLDCSVTWNPGRSLSWETWLHEVWWGWTVIRWSPNETDASATDICNFDATVQRLDGGSSTGLERYADAAAQADVLVIKQCVASDVNQVVKTATTTRYAWVMGEKWQYMQRRLETLHQFRTGFVANIFRFRESECLCGQKQSRFDGSVGSYAGEVIL